MCLVETAIPDGMNLLDVSSAALAFALPTEWRGSTMMSYEGCMHTEHVRGHLDLRSCHVLFKTCWPNIYMLPPPLHANVEYPL